MFLDVPRTIQLAVLQLYLYVCPFYTFMSPSTHIWKLVRHPFPPFPFYILTKLLVKIHLPSHFWAVHLCCTSRKTKTKNLAPPHYSTTSTTSLQEKDPTLCIHHSTTHHLHHRRAKPAPPPPTALPVVILGVSKKALLLRVQYFQANIVQRIYFCCYFAPFQLCLSRTLSAHYFVFFDNIYCKIRSYNAACMAYIYI